MKTQDVSYARPGQFAQGEYAPGRVMIRPLQNVRDAGLARLVLAASHEDRRPALASGVRACEL